MSGSNEAPLSDPFWLVDTAAEGKIVDQVLRRQFAGLMDGLSAALDQADPMDIVYPNNPNEYFDVVREIVVLLASVHGDISRLTDGQLREVVLEGLMRRFGEPPEPERVDAAVRLLRSGV